MTQLPKPDRTRLGGSSRWRPIYLTAMRFWSGEAFRRRVQRLAEDGLERAFDTHGANSFEYRNAYRHAEACRFAAEFGVVENEAVRQVVELALELGAEIEDLRVLVLNKSLYATPDGHVRVRLAWWERWLATSPTIFSVGVWLVLTLHTFRQHGNVWLKAAVLASITAVVAFLWCGWYLYYRGPWVAAGRSRHFINRASIKRLLEKHQTGSPVVKLTN